MRRQYYVLMSQIGVLVAMVAMYISFQNKTERIVKHQYVPAKVPIAYLYSTVRIHCEGNATGVAISPRYIMTCYHVVSSVGKDGTAWVEWTDEDGPHSSVASVVALDDARDLAVLQFMDKATVFKHYATISDNVPTWGTQVMAMGSPCGQYLSPFPGIFVKRGEGRVMDLIEAQCFPGHSGGPIFDNMTGEVIGLTSRLAGVTDFNGITLALTHVFLAVPNTWMLDFIEENGIKLQ